jgi:hypothetical protein
MKAKLRRVNAKKMTMEDYAKILISVLDTKLVSEYGLDYEIVKVDYNQNQE